MRQFFINTSSLFTSVGTLLCCALPALLVAIGAGAALASMLAIFPQLIWLSVYKTWTFSIVGFIMAVNGFMLWKNRNSACPVDAKKAAACTTVKRSSLIIYFISLSLYVVGFLFAFILPLFM